MKVETFEEKYNALQKEGAEIYAAILPLLAKLTGLAHRCKALYAKADKDKELYRKEKRVLFDGRTEDSLEPDGWNFDLMFRLSDMEYVYDSAKGISNVLFNIKHTPFRRRKKGK